MTPEIQTNHQADDLRRGRTLFMALNSPAFRLKSGETIVAVVMLFAFLALLTSFKVIRIDQMYGDSAAFFQASESIADRGLPVSQAQAAIVNYQYDTKYLTTPAEKIARDPNAFGRPTPVSERSLLIGHAYFILYPIAILVKAFPVRDVLMLFYVASFVGLLFGAYAVLRLKGASIVSSVLFCILIVSQPAWSEGLLWGQFYPDRLFILSGFIVMVLASTEETFGKRGFFPRLALLAAACIAASVNERGALVTGVFLVSFSVLYWQRSFADRAYQFFLGIGLLCYGLLVIKFMLPTNPQYGSFLPSSLSGFIYTVQQPSFAKLGLLFLVVNAPLLILAAFEWRAALIALLLMLPNFFGSIGGAEKIGWSTHYPSFYFPSLVWAALLGYASLLRRVQAPSFRRAVQVAVAGLCVFLNMLSPYTYSKITVSLGNISNGFISRANEQIDLYFTQSGPRNALETQAEEIQRAVPVGATVSSVESGMALLYRNRKLELFPADIDHANYVALSAQQVGHSVVYSGAVSYLGADEQARLNEIVLARMKRDGFDLDHPRLFPAFGLAIIRRAR